MVDGSNQIGMGHVMRSITLAKELDHASDVVFITKSESPVQNLIKSFGFEVSQIDDDDEVVPTLQTIGADVIIIDRVTVEEELTRTIKESLDKIRIVLMDIQTEATKWADMVVNALLGGRFENRQYLDEEFNTRYFYGPQYLILRAQFNEYVREEIPEPEKARRILLIFGGSDPRNLTDKTLRELLSLRRQHLEIDLLMGPQFIFKEDIHNTVEEFTAQENVKIIEYTEDVAELMWKSDLVFTSPGITFFEALMVGVHVIVSHQNDLQRGMYDFFYREYTNVPSIFQFSTQFCQPHLLEFICFSVLRRNIEYNLVL